MSLKLFSTLAVLALSVGADSAGPCTSSGANSISVSGVSSLRLRPDSVSFSVGVETTNSSVSDAFKQASARVSAVLAALKSKGVNAEEIQTSSFNITTVTPDKSRPRRFLVESLVTVTRSETSSVGDLLQTAVDAGANQAGSLRFFVADVTAVRQRGLDLAFQDARAKALVLANLSKRTLGAVLCISDELENSAVGDWKSKLYSLGYIAGPTVESGLEEVSFQLSVVFELK